MPIRSSPEDSAGRTFGGLRRTTIDKINDDPKLQELDVAGFNEETKTKVERAQEYGFSSVPLAPSKDKNGKEKKAVAIVGYFGGSRSHGVIVGVDDRRHRPRKLKEGESIQYDDQAQKMHITRNGIEISGGDDNLLQGEDQDQQSGGGADGAKSAGAQQKKSSRSKQLPIKSWTGNGSELIEKDKVTHAVGKTTHVIEDKKHTFVAGNATVTIEDGKITLDVKGTKVIVTPNRVDLGGEGGAKVLTVSGPAKNTYAVV